MGQKVCISLAAGCSRSMMDVGVLFRYFEANGWSFTSDPQAADLILMGGCGFDRLSELYSTRLLDNTSKKAGSSARIVVFGCMPGTSEGVFARRPDVIPMLRREFDKLDEMIGATVPLSSIGDENVVSGCVEQALQVFSKSERLRAALYPSGLKLAQGFASKKLSRLPGFDRTVCEDGVFNIRIAWGCSAKCSYCVIRKASGPIRSKPLPLILQELDSGIARGFKTFRLVAEDVGAYGQDGDQTVCDLLSAIFARDAEFKISWSDLHPIWLLKYRDELVKIFSENGRKLGQIGIPIQAGSDQILKAMHRGYTGDEAVGVLKALVDASPGLQIDTHLMVGFPGESEADFADTLGILDHLKFRRVFPFIYTDRAGAESTELPGKISSVTKVYRLARLVSKICASHRQEQPALVFQGSQLLSENLANGGE